LKTKFGFLSLFYYLCANGLSEDGMELFNEFLVIIFSVIASEARQSQKYISHYHQRWLRTIVLVLTLTVGIPHIYRRDNDDITKNADEPALQFISIPTNRVGTQNSNC
jgi:hypothetical protein